LSALPVWISVSESLIRSLLGKATLKSPVSWHFSSKRGKAIQTYAGIEYASQFGGLRRVAEILIEETRRQAG
jgi:hypothetical protein